MQSASTTGRAANPYPTADLQRARRRASGGAVMLAALALVSGCGESPQGAAPSTAAPPPSVVVAPAQIRPIEEQAELVGRVVAAERVELRARVEGFLKERLFTEGQAVVAGDVLFRIEPDRYQALVEQRRADLAKAEADGENARAQLARGEELLKGNNISRAQVDELRAAASVAEAGIAQARAALAAAELDLGYTEVIAPVSGRIGLASLSVGNLVGPAFGTLATLVSSDPIYVQFPVTQRERLAARRDIQAKGGDPKDVIIRLRLPDGSLYDQSGRLNFVDVSADRGTDSVILRAEIPNPDGTLVDGQYVGVVLQAGQPVEGIVIPQSALQVDQQGTYVLIVDGDSKAQVRRIQTGPAVGAGIAVTRGLSEGELVMTQGVQKVRPGEAVTATPAQDAGSAAP
jgi:membrane fusion protein, multidrug efflux system